MSTQVAWAANTFSWSHPVSEGPLLIVSSASFISDNEWSASATCIYPGECRSHDLTPTERVSREEAQSRCVRFVAVYDFLRFWILAFGNEQKRDEALPW